MKQDTLMPKAWPDYPAAHSMDTHWFAIDETGEVAIFDTHETGPVPQGPSAVDGLSNLPAFLSRDEHGVPFLEAVGDPLGSGEVLRDVERILARLSEEERAALDQLMMDRGLSEAQSATLKRAIRANVWGVFVELLDAADAGEFARDGGVIRVHRTRPVYHLFEGTALASALCLLLRQRVAAWRWVTPAEYRDMAVDVYGMYAFEQVDQAHDFHEYLIAPAVPPPYACRRLPKQPRHGMETGMATPEHPAPVHALPGVSFARPGRLQVADSIHCQGWDPVSVPRSGEARVRQYLIAYYEADPSARAVLLDSVRHLAASGDLIAQHVSGCLCGRSDVARLEESARWFEAAARQAQCAGGDDHDKFSKGLAAQYCLADAYERGRGVVQDEAMAIHWLGRAAEGGLDLAQYQLGMRYKEGRGVAVDGARARRLLRAAAAQGHHKARWVLKGYPDPEGANAGDAQAQYELAAMHAVGRAVDKSMALAAHWYAAAAAQGHGPALLELAELLTAEPALAAGRFGPLVRDQLKASAERGNPQAQYRWGKGLLAGTFGEVDIGEAHRWLSVAKDAGMHEAGRWLAQLSVWPAAEAGDARSGYRLAWLFQDLKNYSHAVLWYRKVIAALERQPVDSADMFENGSAAKCNLADKYEHGLGVPQDHQQALYWYRESAAQNNCVAQYSLGNMYLQGLGVPRDVEMARQWLRKSAAQGYQDAQDVLDGLAGTL